MIGKQNRYVEEVSNKGNDASHSFSIFIRVHLLLTIMSWLSIIGQARVQKILHAAWESHRIPHAMLFYGMEGVGKAAVAIEFARTLNCESGEWNACGQCRSCRMMEKLQHPNVKLVFPLPRGKNEDDIHDPYEKLDADQMEAIMEQLGSKAENLYHRIHIPGASVIKINSIREVKRDSYWHPGGKGRPVVIISGADKMNAAASNSLLKTLEEPTGDLLLILTTNRRDALLSTIISRCQQIRFDPLHEDEIAEALKHKTDLSPEARIVAAKLSNGSYGKALELIEEHVMANRESIVEFLRAVMKQDAEEILQKIEPFGTVNDRQAVMDFLSSLSLWFRDIHAMREGCGDRIINVDLIISLQKFADHYTDARPEDAIRSLERSIDLIQRNVNINLVLITLSHTLYRCIKPNS